MSYTEGNGNKIDGSCSIRIGYIIEDLEGNVLFANHDTWINLAQTIPSFSHGIQGMQVGEKRTIYIHPAYGYGALTTLPPCSGLVIKCHLIDIDEKKPTSLLPLEPFDMEWVKDPSFFADIASSLKQQPIYLGFLYRTFLEQVEGVDFEKVISTLKIEQTTKAAASPLQRQRSCQPRLCSGKEKSKYQRSERGGSIYRSRSQPSSPPLPSCEITARPS